MKTLITFLAVAAISNAAHAADVTGTWKADFDTQRGLQKYTFTLKQEGAKVTGKANVEREGEKRERACRARHSEHVAAAKTLRNG